MRYIDKYCHAAEGHAVNVQFLQDCYQGAGLPMIPQSDDPKQSFEDFKKAKYRYGDNGLTGWQKLLMQEQDSHCCYCMRNLEGEKISIEHVVPRMLSKQRGKKEFADYEANAPAIHDYVLLAEDFAKKQLATLQDIDSEQRMPHIIAEANLLAACNGKRGVPNTGCCCNNTRQDAYMLPLMLMQECNQRVDYDENGLMSVLPVEKSLETIVSELNDETLKRVRMIWYKISRTNYTLTAVKALVDYIDKVNLIKTAFTANNFETLPDGIKQFANQQFYWALLMDYDWFYGFYHERKIEHT